MQKTSKPKTINWVAVRAEYEAGGVTLQQLADRLGVSRKTVERRSSREDWVKGVRKDPDDVSERVSQEVRKIIVEKRVKKALSDLEMIDNVIALTYKAIIENSDNFKTTGEAIAALDKMQKTKLEYSDERIQKWLLDKGYVAVPIAELAPASEIIKESTESAFADILDTES